MCGLYSKGYSTSHPKLGCPMRARFLPVPPIRACRGASRGMYRQMFFKEAEPNRHRLNRLDRLNRMDGMD